MNWKEHILESHILPLDPSKVSPEQINRLNQGERMVDVLPESLLKVKLAGLKHLVREQGYKSIRYEPLSIERDFVSVMCMIEFIHNSELVTVSAMADATQQNSNGLFSLYLTALAENRAFARCARTFFGIEAVSEEEMQYAGVVNEVSQHSDVPVQSGIDVLKATLSRCKMNFMQVRSLATQQGVNGAAAWLSINDIPLDLVPRLISLINERGESHEIKVEAEQAKQESVSGELPFSDNSSEVQVDSIDQNSIEYVKKTIEDNSVNVDKLEAYMVSELWIKPGQVFTAISDENLPKLVKLLKNPTKIKKFK